MLKILLPSCMFLTELRRITRIRKQEKKTKYKLDLFTKGKTDTTTTIRNSETQLNPHHQLAQKDEPGSTESRNSVILASLMNPLLKIMAHLKTARREYQNTCPHEQIATTATYHTFNNQTEHLLGPDTTCTRCRTEQNEPQLPYSINWAHSAHNCLTHHHKKLNQAHVVLGCERRPNARCNGQ